MMRGCVHCQADQRACERCAPFWAGCIIYLAIALLAACFGTNTLPDTNPAPAANVRRIVGTAALMRDDWEHSGWRRIDDPYFSWPVLLAIATDGSACVISGPLWAVLKRGDGVACETAWRLRR